MMNYFAAQVKTLCEDHYISNVSKNLSHRKENQKFHFLKRKLKIKKRGKFICEVKPVFPGYIFIETKTIDADLYDIMRRTQGFYRFLKSNKDIVPLNEHDFFLIKHLLSYGDIADESNVYFDKNDKIIVTEGPLKNIEGLIVKVDRRKKRAKISMNFSDNPFFLDLSFNVIKNTETNT